MSLEQRMDYLLKAAQRAERNGERRLALALRRMAEDTRPIDRALTIPLRSTPGT